jgi:hypothetical protein
MTMAIARAARHAPALSAVRIDNMSQVETTG